MLINACVLVANRKWRFQWNLGYIKSIDFMRPEYGILQRLPFCRARIHVFVFSIKHPSISKEKKQPSKIFEKPKNQKD